MERRTLDKTDSPRGLVEYRKVAHPGGRLVHHDVHAVVDEHPVILDV